MHNDARNGHVLSRQASGLTHLFVPSPCPCMSAKPILLIAWDNCYLHRSDVSGALAYIWLFHLSTADLALQVGRASDNNLGSLSCFPRSQHAHSLSSVSAWESVGQCGEPISPIPWPGLFYISLQITSEDGLFSPTLRGTMCALSSSAEGKSYFTAACTRKQ